MSININGLENYNKSKNKRICIGTFDGFHKGHQKLTEKSNFLVTFDPHPKNILTKNLVCAFQLPLSFCVCIKGFLSTDNAFKNWL